MRTSLTISCNTQGSPAGNATPVLDSMWAISDRSELLVVIGEKFQLYNIKFDYSNEGRILPIIVYYAFIGIAGVVTVLKINNGGHLVIMVRMLKSCIIIMRLIIIHIIWDS